MEYIYCKNCKSYRIKLEYGVNGGFINEDLKDIEIVCEGGGIRMCQHSSCFIIGKSFDIVKGLVSSKNRIAGQGQLNKDYDCKHYKRKWWKFWVKRSDVQNFQIGEDMTKSFIHTRPDLETDPPIERT